MAFQGEAAASFPCAGCVAPLAAFFFMFVYTCGAYILCAGCGDPGRLSFWVVLGTVSCIAGASYIFAGCVDPLATFLLHDCIYMWGSYFVRWLPGSAPAAFWLFPGHALRALGVVVVVIFFTDCFDLCP